MVSDDSKEIPDPSRITTEGSVCPIHFVDWATRRVLLDVAFARRSGPVSNSEWVP